VSNDEHVRLHSPLSTRSGTRATRRECQRPNGIGRNPCITINDRATNTSSQSQKTELLTSTNKPGRPVVRRRCQRAPFQKKHRPSIPIPCHWSMQPGPVSNVGWPTDPSPPRAARGIGNLPLDVLERTCANTRPSSLWLEHPTGLSHAMFGTIPCTRVDRLERKPFLCRNQPLGRRACNAYDVVGPVDGQGSPISSLFMRRSGVLASAAIACSAQFVCRLRMHERLALLRFL
jgi:hypothetical protein